MPLENVLIQLAAQLSEFIGSGGTVGAVTHALCTAVIATVQPQVKLQLDLVKRYAGCRPEKNVPCRHGETEKSIQIDR